LFVNHPETVKAHLPFGGTRHSGSAPMRFVNHKPIDVVDIETAFRVCVAAALHGDGDAVQA